MEVQASLARVFQTVDLPSSLLVAKQREVATALVGTVESEDEDIW